MNVIRNRETTEKGGEEKQRKRERERMKKKGGGGETTEKDRWKPMEKRDSALARTDVGRRVWKLNLRRGRFTVAPFKAISRAKYALVGHYKVIIV